MKVMSRLGGLAAVLVAAFAVTLVSPASDAAAASASDFDPGMIISDAKFYDSNAMTASQIQSFLEAKVPTCRPWKDSNPSDITCMKDYVTTTVTKSSNSNCAATSARTATAAQVIDIVARACGVSQKVLLVTLQKEQGLVTHDWPSSFRYDKAMGYACPDTGPGGSGNCDSAYFGFFNQVYRAAWQFKQYRANAGNYGYQAGRWNSIKRHPNSACGTVDVYIKNQATAGLYIYTPYVPNAKALAAGYGTGDSCSSYGNRNFFLYYSDWFGSTSGPSLYPRLESAYEERGGEATLGAPIAETVWEPANGGGWYQRMEKGTLYLTRAGTDSFRPNGSGITAAYEAAGGPGGPWGWPIANSVTFDGMPLVEFHHLRVRLDGNTAVPGYPYSDVSDRRGSSDYAALAESIFWMARQDIAEGWPSKYGPQFRRTEEVTRDAMAAFLYRYSEGEEATGAGVDFIDVSESSSDFATEIEWLAQSGISTGWETEEGPEYRPFAPTSRDAMAAFLFRLEGPDSYEPPAVSPFTDVDVASPFYREISWLYEQGISNGWGSSSDREFRPHQPVTREAMAAFLHRLSALQ